MIKNIFINLWKVIHHIFVVINFNLIFKSEKIKIFYAGAISGHIGGPFVKIRRIKNFFPKQYLSFNLVYILSNAIFLMPKSIQMLKRLNIPIILNQNGVFYPGWYQGDWKKKNLEMSNIYHQANFVFWQSEFCKNCANKFLGKRKGPGEVLYNCVDTKFFVPKFKTIAKNKRLFTFLITGNITHALGYRVISALKGLNIAIKKGLNANIILAGHLDDRVLMDCKNLVEQLKIPNKFTYIGKYTQTNAPHIYQKGDAYIMLKYKDPCPNTVIEAMSCGLPILYSNSGGLPEIVDKDCGISLNVKETWKKSDIVPKYSDIAEGMIKIYKNHKKLSFNARKSAVSKFDLTFWIERHKSIFEKYKSS